MIFSCWHNGFPLDSLYYYEALTNKPFLGQVVTLEFGDYEVAMTVPADHIGRQRAMQNPEEVLTKNNEKRLEKAKTASASRFHCDRR